MLSRSPPTRLCQSCRNELLSIFESGFSSPLPRARYPRLVRKPPTQSSRQTRFFTACSSVRQDRPLKDFATVPNELANRDEKVPDADRIQSELAVLEQLEKELGQPIEEAIREDRDAQAQTEQVQDVDSERVPASALTEGAADQVAVLRASGVSSEAIAREARQLFGEGLPQGVLEEEEFKIYRRFYGDPAEQIPGQAQELVDEVDGGVDRYEDIGGQAELLDLEGERVLHDSTQDLGPAGLSKVSEQLGQVEQSDTDTSTLAAEYHRDVDGSETKAWSPFSRENVEIIAQSLGATVHEDEGYEQEEQEDDADPDDRAHPLSSLGRFQTSPRTVFLPQDTFVKPVEKILSNYANRHIKEVSEKVFGGSGLPNSPLTPRSGRTKEQVAIPLTASQHQMGEMEANTFLTAVMPPTYAAITSVLTETRKRLGSSWLLDLIKRQEGPRILDAGSGGVGILAWRDVVAAEWKALHSSSVAGVPPVPASKAVVLTGSDTLRHRSANLLENTTFIPRLPDYVHTRDSPTLDDARNPQPRKQFDVIIAPHTIFPLDEDWQRKQHVQNLWSLLAPEGGVLILVEKGIPRGFEAIAGAREMLLQHYISSPNSETYETELNSKLSQEEQITEKSPGMIIAPCTNHHKCPMYTTPGLSRGRKDFCSFQQRYIRPPFLQRVLGATDRSHDDVDFSYLSVMKGLDLRQTSPSSFDDIVNPFPLLSNISPEATATPSSSDSPHSLLTAYPRTIYSPLKRRGHVTLDLCTRHGKIERWTVPKSFSRQAYRDARKAKWGDLWALDAKSKTTRNLRLGGKESKEAMKAREVKERLMESAVEDGLDEEREAHELDIVAEDEDGDVDVAVEQTLKEWGDEYEHDNKHRQGRKKGGAFAGGSKAAKMLQKSEWVAAEREKGSAARGRMRRS